MDAPTVRGMITEVYPLATNLPRAYCEMIQKRLYRQLPWFGAALLTLSGFVAWQQVHGRDDKPTPAAGRDSSQFETDIRPILEAHCFRCHGEKMRKADLDLRSESGIHKGSEGGPVLIPGKPLESKLFLLVRDGAMPPGKKDRLDVKNVELIRRWIETGARFGATAKEPPVKATAALTQYDVLPILFRRCTVCHGARQREAGLDLRSKASMLKGGKSGPAIVPGHPDASLVLKKIHSGEMPPRRRVVEASIKPIEPAETEIVARWIAHGAPEVEIKPDIASRDPDPLVSDKERAFWSFQPPKRPVVPGVQHADRVRNPIDAFVLAKLEEKELTLSPEADRLTLLRRAALDLTGLLPEPEDVSAFLEDRRPDAYERMIDRLLASPRYGERWGRYWLDVAGYADTEGKREQDILRPFAYRYRDYVIQAFNADKPYDRFLTEQLAGDELADYENAKEITQEMHDHLVATGFLRMAPDPTWANITNFLPDRIDVIADEIDVFGAAVLGLTIKCARCHSHKFDPIPHRDYYRLLATFKGAFDEHDWIKSGWNGTLSKGQRSERELPTVLSSERRQWDRENKRIERERAEHQAKLDRLVEAKRARVYQEQLQQLPDVLRADVKAALELPAEKRNAVQSYLAGKFAKTLRPERDELAKLDPAFKQQAEPLERRLKELQNEQSPEPTIRALWDRGEPSPTYLLRRGDYLQPARLVGPGVPSVLTDGKTPFDVTPPWPGAKKTGRRLALARWLTQPDHPLTARVMVNRIWKHHFGAGIVKTLDNFGKAGAPPSHPELLDWLAREFVNRGWSVKAMHRLIMQSATYRQNSTIADFRLRIADSSNSQSAINNPQSISPNDRLLSRFPPKRMDAEALYDSLLQVAGRLDERRFGPADRVEVRADGLATPVGTEHGWRRSVYVQQQRKIIVTHLENFDYPQMNPNCVERRDSTVALQALHLMNNGMVQNLAEQFAARVQREVGDDPAARIDRVYQIALNRPPTPDEKALGREALTQLTAKWSKTAKTKPADAAFKALTTYCHTIVNSAAFLYVD